MWLSLIPIGVQSRSVFVHRELYVRAVNVSNYADSGNMFVFIQAVESKTLKLILPSV